MCHLKTALLWQSVDQPGFPAGDVAGLRYDPYISALTFSTSHPSLPKGTWRGTKDSCVDSPGRRRLTTLSNKFLSAVTRFSTWFKSCVGKTRERLYFLGGPPEAKLLLWMKSLGKQKLLSKKSPNL